MSTAMAVPASNPFFANNAGGNNSAFQSTAGMLQGGGHTFFNPQPQGGAPQQGPAQGGAPAGGGTAGGGPSAVFAHHAFANPQQLAGSPASQQGAQAQAGALPHFDSNTAQAGLLPLLPGGVARHGISSTPAQVTCIHKESAWHQQH